MRRQIPSAAKPHPQAVVKFRPHTRRSFHHRPLRQLFLQARRNYQPQLTSKLTARGRTPHRAIARQSPFRTFKRSSGGTPRQDVRRDQQLSNRQLCDTAFAAEIIGSPYQWKSLPTPNLHRRSRSAGPAGASPPHRTGSRQHFDFILSSGKQLPQRRLHLPGPLVQIAMKLLPNLPIQRARAIQSL